MGVGRAKKSMGNVTYRTVRGRTIGSQKRVPGVSGAITRGQAGNIRKPLFAMINMFMAAHASDIEVSFNKSKYGSQRNYFFKLNYRGMSAALLSLAQAASASGDLPFESEIEAAINAYVAENPDAIFRVKLDGFENQYMTGPWSSDDNPISGGAQDGLGTGTASTTVGDKAATAPIALSMNFHAGAKMVHDGAKVTLESPAIPSGVAVADIAYLTAGNKVIDGIVVSGVTSRAGTLLYTTGAITAANNAVAVRIKNIYVRLTSAYVTNEDGQNPNPLG